jgi:uncharacterized protein YigE (DUF2233 family)
MIGRLVSVFFGAATFGLGAIGLLSMQRGAAQPPEKACANWTFEGEGFVVCTFDPRNSDLKLTTSARRFPELSKDLGAGRDHVLFAMNAGMYGVSGDPIGLYIENGKQKRAVNAGKTGMGNFYMQPNGVFWVDANGVHASVTDEFVAAKPKAKWATQSGPMMLMDGKLHPEITEDGPSRNIRNGVGVRDKHTAFFAISDKPISFGKLARFFRDELKCDDALYLDGAVSSLWDPHGERMDKGYDLGPVVVVSAKK